jgi:hypothetical protein
LYGPTARSTRRLGQKKDSDFFSRHVVAVGHKVIMRHASGFA